ncbi:MAG: response regulator [Chloroflexota bacterium]
MKTRVLLADDHLMFREGVRQILSNASDIEVVGEASDGAEAERKARELSPDVVLMDLSMPGADGTTAIQHIAAKLPQVRIVVLTMHRGDKHVIEALRAGAQGYVLKDAPASELLRAIREVQSGRSPLDPSVSTLVLTEFRRLAVQQDASAEPSVLSPKEVEILRLVAGGLTNKEIGARLFLAEKTVKNYLTAIFQKLGITDRVQAAIYAQRQGLLPEGDQE